MGSHHGPHSAVPPLIALVDGNCFFCSCQRLFEPTLRSRPLVVLSSNDGCVVSRTNEAKQLGIRMGQPHFEIRSLVNARQVEVRSSNFALYSDISRRIQSILAMLSPHVEPYSIDESFLEVPQTDNPLAWGINVTEHVQKWCGIPVGVGIGSTKVLAKVANHLAKRTLEPQCIEANDPRLHDFPIEEVWGIGRRLSTQMRGLEIRTAGDLAQTDPRLVRKRWGVVGERLALELQGIPCLGFEESPEPRKSMLCSRTFDHPLSDLNALEEALRWMMETVAEQLREEKSEAGVLQVFLESQGRHSPNPHAVEQIHLFHPKTDSTSQILTAGCALLQSLHTEGMHYRRGGIQLMDLSPSTAHQDELFETPRSPQSIALLKAVDEINQNFGSGKIRWGAGKRKNLVKQELLSSRFTTHWSELPVAIGS